MKRTKIISFGEILYDVFPDSSHLGGAPLNFAVHCHRNGADIQLISAVGDDEPGHNAVKRISELGIDTGSIALLKDKETGKVTITLDENSIPTYTFDSDCAYDHIPVPENFSADADVFCFGLLAQRNPASRSALFKLLDNFDGKVFCDVNLRQDFYSAELLDASLRRADIVKLNEDELPVITELFGIVCTPQALADHFGLEMVIYTLGADGCQIYSGSETITLPAAPARVVSTVGAGDAFSAAFLTSYLGGNDIKSSAEAATQAAARTTEITGAF